MIGFIELRRSLSGVKGQWYSPYMLETLLILTDITTLDPVNLIAPFVALVRSPLTSGPITSLALASLYSLTTSILPLFFTPPPSSPLPATATPLQIALTHLTSALATCRFPSSSPQQDELVLLRLLRVIETLTMPLQIPGSSHVYWTLLDHMSDESVCELLEVGLGMLARARLTEGLRNAAGICVGSITRQVFGRLKGLNKEDVEKLIKAMAEDDKEKVTQVNVPPAKPENVDENLAEKQTPVAVDSPVDQDKPEGASVSSKVSMESTASASESE
jgi:brefeldin A-resistance guanine nucleotide exchange factor 1